MFEKSKICITIIIELVLELENMSKEKSLNKQSYYVAVDLY